MAQKWCSFIMAGHYETYLLGRCRKTKELGYMKLLGLVRFMSLDTRKVGTRLSDDAQAFADLINVRVREVDTIWVTSKRFRVTRRTYWRDVSVSGSGSRMLFASDRNYFIINGSLFCKHQRLRVIKKSLLVNHKK